MYTILLRTSMGPWLIAFIIMVASGLVVFLVFKGLGFLMNLLLSKKYSKRDLAEIMVAMYSEFEKSQHRQRAFEKQITQKLELLGNAQVKTFKETGKALEIVANRLEASKPTDDITKIRAGINADFISLNRKLDAFFAKRKEDEDSILYILQKLKRIVGETTLEDIDKMHRTAANHEFNRIIGAIEEYMTGPYPRLKEEV